ncbi:hypothetical protein BC831DRAFT_516765, partial [Entophlyctis helioformis]
MSQVADAASAAVHAYSPEWHPVFQTICISIGASGVLLNATLFTLIIRYPQLHSLDNRFFASMAIANAMLAFCILSISAANMSSADHVSVLVKLPVACQIAGYLTQSLATISITSILAVASYHYRITVLECPKPRFRERAA